MIVLSLLLMFAQQRQDTVELKPVVVTATRAAVPSVLVPVATTVLRGADLEARGVRTVAQALQLVPGAHVVETGSYGGQTSLFMRGGENDYVKVLVDGVALNLPGGGLDLAHLTTDNVDRIEVVRGPASGYGSDAVTGVADLHACRNGTTAVRRGCARGHLREHAGRVDLEGGTPTLGYSVRVSRFGSTDCIRSTTSTGMACSAAGSSSDPTSEQKQACRIATVTICTTSRRMGRGSRPTRTRRSAERGPLASLCRGVVGSIEVSTQATWREARQLFNDEPDSPGEDGTFWSDDYVRRAGAGLLLTWRARGAGSTSVSAGVDYEDERQRGRSEFSASFGTFPDSIDVQRWTTGTTPGGATCSVSRITGGGRLDDNFNSTHGTYRSSSLIRR
jgi:vitamin B12 transporter